MPGRTQTAPQRSSPEIDLLRRKHKHGGKLKTAISVPVSALQMVRASWSSRLARCGAQGLFYLDFSKDQAQPLDLYGRGSASSPSIFLDQVFNYLSTFLDYARDLNVSFLLRGRCAGEVSSASARPTHARVGVSGKALRVFLAQCADQFLTCSALGASGISSTAALPVFHGPLLLTLAGAMAL